MRKVVFALVVLTIIGSGYEVWHNKNQKLTTNNSTPAPLTQPTPTASNQKITPSPIKFNKAKYSLTNPTSPWVVVSKTRPLGPLTYAPADLVNVGNGQLMRTEAATALSKMFAAANAAQLSLSALSGYRSYATQVSVYNREVANYGQKVADSESARPGHSEHQTGWAVDLGGGGCGIEDCFGNTAEGKWVAANAYRYGFIVRYTQDKVAITGYRAEPWHVRYIGTYLSEEMHIQNITTLEEFFNL